MAVHSQRDIISGVLGSVFLTLLRTASTALFDSPSLGAAATQSPTASPVSEVTPSRVLATPGFTWHRRWTVGSLFLPEGAMYWRKRCVVVAVAAAAIISTCIVYFFWVKK